MYFVWFKTSNNCKSVFDFQSKLGQTLKASILRFVCYRSSYDHKYAGLGWYINIDKYTKVLKCQISNFDVLKIDTQINLAAGNHAHG